MLHKKPRRLLASFGLFLLAAPPVAYAADVATPAANSAPTPAASQTSPGIEFSSDRVDGEHGGSSLVLIGNVQVRVPASITVNWTSDNVTRQSNGALLMEGAVNMTAGSSHISARSAVVTHADNGDTLISTDRALVVRG